MQAEATGLVVPSADGEPSPAAAPCHALRRRPATPCHALRRPATPCGALSPPSPRPLLQLEPTGSH
ncbi:hypothetical protein EYF80_061727 [Liparis tanakae]|uniref:Uncharacterized protein n=1 Tax=Liparis tanakae TaxID=230148 RepID=A0A4Z2EHA3_9TELE|nr:hypothetical protein EYF80_061727 [Liparis tanakae]